MRHEVHLHVNVGDHPFIAVVPTEHYDRTTKRGDSVSPRPIGLRVGEKHGHTIAPEFTGWSGHLEKVTTQIAGGTEADIMQINWPWLPLFSINGEGFADLRGYSDTIDLSQWTDAQLDAATMNGMLNGLPLSTTGRVFLFNKTTFEKAGLEVSTREELGAAAAVLKEQLGEGYYPFDANGLNAWLIVSLIAAQETGPDLIDPETNTVAWSEEEPASAIEFYQTLVDEGVIRSWKDAAGEGSAQLFENPRWASGEIAGSYEWDSTYFKDSDPLEEGEELVQVKLLTVDGAQTEGVYRKPSMVFSISKNSENPEAAAQILNCLLTEPEGIAALGDTRGLPASKIAAQTLSDAGAIDPTLVSANQINMETEGPNVSPFKEHPVVRWLFQDSLELFAYDRLGDHQWRQRSPRGLQQLNRVRALPGAPATSTASRSRRASAAQRAPGTWRPPVTFGSGIAAWSVDMAPTS